MSLTSAETAWVRQRCLFALGHGPTNPMRLAGEVTGIAGAPSFGGWTACKSALKMALDALVAEGKATYDERLKVYQIGSGRRK